MVSNIVKSNGSDHAIRKKIKVIVNIIGNDNDKDHHVNNQLHVIHPYFRQHHQAFLPYELKLKNTNLEDIQKYNKYKDGINLENE